MALPRVRGDREYQKFFEAGSEVAVRVGIFDSTGSLIEDFGGGANYAEDSAHQSGDTGNFILAVRNDAGGSLVDTDGDYAPLQIDANGKLVVTGGTGGTSATDEDAFTAGSTDGTPSMGVYQVTADLLTDDQLGIPRMTNDRRWMVDVSGSTGGAVVEAALEETAYDLNAAAYNDTTNITDDYILDNVVMDFSTTQSRTITITTDKGTTIYERTSTALNVSITQIEKAMDGGDNITINVTQTAGACTMDLRCNVRKSSASLVGTPYVYIWDGTDVADVVTNTDDDTDLDGLNGLVTDAKAYFRIDADTVKPARMDASTHTIQNIEYEHHEIHGNSHYFVEDFTPEGTFDSTDVLDFCFTTDDSAAWVHFVFNFDARGDTQLDVYEGCTFTANTGTLVVQRANNRAKTYGGSHTAGTSATVMTDSSASFTVDALIGWKIYNVTDGSYGIVTDNDATTVTVAALVGGTDNDWDTNDDYEINKSLSLLRMDCTVTDLGIRIGGQAGGDATTPNKGIPGGASRENELVLRQNTSYLFRFTSGVNDNILSYNGEWYEHTDKD